MDLTRWVMPENLNMCANKAIAEADILEAHRFIYLFFDENDIENHNTGNIIHGNTIIGKAIQINLSISKGGNKIIDLSPWERGSKNSTYMTVAMYVYDTLFETDITNFTGAQFTLVNSLVSSTTNDYDLRKAFMNGENLYSKDLRDKPEKKNILSNGLYQGAPSIPEPMYYTMAQQEIAEDDIYCLTALTNSVVHIGEELLDDFTHISVMNVGMMDSMLPIIREKIYEVRNNVRSSDYKLNMYDSTELSEMLLFQDFNSMQSGYTYIYDTNMGVNIIKTGKAYLPFQNYQFKDKMSGDIERTLDIIKAHAKQVEQQFGAVRMVFTPLYFGDKQDVVFKDYNKDNQPILKENINIDNGMKVQDEIIERLYDVEDSESLEIDYTNNNEEIW